MEQIYDKAITPDEVKEILINGNKRFVTGALSNKDLSLNRRINLARNGQKPIVAILTCCDSRVSPELIFDQGLGDLYVIRNAGNIVDTVVLGSIEFALETLNLSLIIILAHEKCGAIKATVEGKKVPSNLKSIVDIITPSLKKVKLSNEAKCIEELSCQVEEENAKHSAKILIKNPIIKRLIHQGKLKVISAKYYLETGEIKFL